MLLGQGRTWLLRWGLVSVGVVWTSSLLLPVLLERSWLPSRGKEPARRLVLWMQKSQLQGLLFFVLPVYHRSATYPSRSALFMLLLAAAALASTIDVVYDEFVARRTWLLGALLAFAAFACVNLTLPMIFLVGGAKNVAASAAVATLIFVSFWARHARAGGHAWWQVAAVGLAFLLVATVGRPLVPPAPLRLVSASFGTSLSPDGLSVPDPLASLPAAAPVRLHAVVAVTAPAGLAEGVRHVWWAGGTRLAESRLIGVTGGRAQGFRSQSSATVRSLAAGQRVRLEVETASGQLIGRAELPVR
jgi:hypothetical protein